jgi:hypothetical protein
MAVFWAVVPCSLVEVYQRFRSPCCQKKPGTDDNIEKVKQASYTIYILQRLFIVFNIFWKYGHIPEEWKAVIFLSSLEKPLKVTVVTVGVLVY